MALLVEYGHLLLQDHFSSDPVKSYLLMFFEIWLLYQLIWIFLKNPQSWQGSICLHWSRTSWHHVLPLHHHPRFVTSRPQKSHGSWIGEDRYMKPVGWMISPSPGVDVCVQVCPIHGCRIILQATMGGCFSPQTLGNEELEPKYRSHVFKNKNLSKPVYLVSSPGLYHHLFLFSQNPTAKAPKLFKSFLASNRYT